jgi:hypothetical protein
MGMRSGLLSGLNARFVPSTADEFAAALPAVTAPDGLWLFDEASGDFLDRVGSNDFSVAAGTVTRGVATPFGQGITLADADGQLQISDTDYLDAPAAATISVFVLVWVPPSVTATATIISKRASDRGWQLRALTSGALHGLVNFANAVVGLSEDYRGRWTPVVMTIDRGAELFTLATDLETVSVDCTSASDFTSTAPVTIGDPGFDPPQPGTRIAYAEGWADHALTATERQILRDFFA